MDSRSNFYLLFFVLTLFSCDQEVIGDWKLDIFSYDSSLPIKYLLIDKNRTTIVDDNHLRYFFNYQLISNRIVLENEFQKIEFELERSSPNGIRLDSLEFVSISDSELGKLQYIKDVGIRTNTLINDKPDQIKYNIIGWINEERKLVLKMGDRISKIEEIPLYVSCYHCRM